MTEEERDVALDARIDSEKQIVRATVQALLGLGHTLSVSWERGYDHDEMLSGSSDEAAIMEAAFAGDDCHLFVHRQGEPVLLQGQVNCVGWVYFVYGNSGWDVISDYTTNLEEAIKPALALADEIDEKAHAQDGD